VVGRAVKILGLLCALMILPAVARAATINAPTCAESDISTAIGSASNSDTVNVTSGGSVTWSSQLHITKNITLDLTGCTIDDHVPSGNEMIYWSGTYGTGTCTTTSSLCFRLTNGTLKTTMGAGSIYSPFAADGTCTSAWCPNIRYDHITFDSSFNGTIVNSNTLSVVNNVFGVADHNIMNAGGPAGIYEFVDFNNSAWQGVGAYGDNSWAQADTFGTAAAFYLENNTFSQGTPTDTESGTPVGEGGGRLVARFNTSTDYFGNHGTESNGRPRGGRQLEAYGNTITCMNSSGGCQAITFVRSGVVIAFGNTIAVTGGAFWNQYVSLNDYRTAANFATWGACDGANPYDNNDGVTYYSGTVGSTSASGNDTTITDSGSPGWTTNQWAPAGAPYAIYDVTKGTGVFDWKNTANTITGSGWTGPPSFSNGDSYQILRASACIDQPTRGPGLLMQNSTPVLQSTGNPGWPAEPIDPAVEWDNRGTAPNFSNVTTSLMGQAAALRDWYSDNSHGANKVQTSSSSPFNCNGSTGGVGFGTLANRPSTCSGACTTYTIGCFYFATDQGSWNTSSNGFGQGILYAWESGAWTQYYEPYTYPHPLTQGTVAKPLPPLNMSLSAH